MGQVSQHSEPSASFDLPDPAGGPLLNRTADDATTRPDPQPAPFTPRPSKRNKRRLDDRFGALFGSPPSVPLPLFSASSKDGPPSTRPHSTSTTSDGPPSRLCSPTQTSPGQPLSRQALFAEDGPPSQATVKSHSSKDGPPSTLSNSRAILLVRRSPSPPPGPQPLALPLEDGSCRNPRVRQPSLLKGLPRYSSTPPRGPGSPESPIVTPGWWLSPLDGDKELYEVDTLALVRRKLTI